MRGRRREGNSLGKYDDLHIKMLKHTYKSKSFCQLETEVELSDDEKSWIASLSNIGNI